jgi:hypothetical protein
MLKQNVTAPVTPKISQAFSCDFGFARCAEAYAKLYEALN